jgi:hypothetical protein
VGDLQENRVLTIADRTDAERAATTATWLSRPRVAAVEIAIHGVDAPRAAALGARIRRLYNDCGCAWGELALAAALVVVALGPALVGWPAGLGWGSGVLVCAGAAVAGKLAGLAWSRWRVRLLLRQLAATSA